MLQELRGQKSHVSSSATLKVTLLGDTWVSAAGDLSTLNRELAINLSRHPRVKVTVLVPERACKDDEKREARSHGITVVEAKKRPGFDPINWLSFPPADLTVDVVFGHGVKLGRQGNYIRDNAAHFPNCKWVQIVSTAPEELSMQKNYAYPMLKGQSKYQDEVDLCKLADLVVPIGPRLEEAYSSYLRQFKADRVFAVTPGLFDREFGDLERAPNENTKFKVLLCGGGDDEDFELKGYDIVAKALTDHQLNEKSYHLIFVGAPDGKQEEVRRKFLQSGTAKEQLTVRNFVQSRDRMKDLLNEVDLAIMPSRSEGFGLVALEALSAGLPVLVSGNSGFAKALENLPFGKSCIVDSDDPAKWAEAIKDVRAKHQMRLEEIKALRASYKKKYSWKEQCDALVEKMWCLVHGASSTAHHDTSSISERCEEITKELQSSKRTASKAVEGTLTSEGVSSAAHHDTVSFQNKEESQSSRRTASEAFERTSEGGKKNFQRLARLLIIGGTCLLREMFDVICPPTRLPTTLSSRATKNLLKTAKLTKPQWDCLYPSPRVYGKSTDFDVTLLFRLLRAICGLTPPPSTGNWDVLPAVTDHSLPADLARIKFYRNTVYGHVDWMEITDDDFPSLWKQISEALMRIAEKISEERKIEWQGAISDFLESPLTEEDERNVEELKRWYKADMDVKESVESLEDTITQEGNRLETAVQGEGQGNRDELGKMHQFFNRPSSSLACIQSAGGISAQREGVPSEYELDELSQKLGYSWKCLARRLGFHEAEITGFHKDNKEYSSKALQMLFQWKQKRGCDATYSVLYDALCDKLVRRRDLAEVFSCDHHLHRWAPNQPGASTSALHDSTSLSNIPGAALKAFDDSSSSYQKGAGSFAHHDSTSSIHPSVATRGRPRRTASKALKGSSSSEGASTSGHHGSTSVSNTSRVTRKGRSPTKRTASKALKGSSSHEGASTSAHHESSSVSNSSRLTRTGRPLSKRTASEVLKDYSSSEGASGTVNHDTTSVSERGGEIRKASQSSKRTASEVFEETFTGESEVPGDLNVLNDAEPNRKRSKSEAPEEQSNADSDSDTSDEQFDAEVVFALDSSVSDGNFQKQFDFVTHLAESLKIPKRALAVYGDFAKTVPFYPNSAHLNERFESKCRRMDMALTEAAGNFSSSPSHNQLVVLITAGRQLSGAESKVDDHSLLVSASEMLYSRNVQVIVVPVGLDTDFRELGLMVKRPQFVFPLSSFDDMTPDTAQEIASNVLKTTDLEAYAKVTALNCLKTAEESDLWENVSLCSYVVEGSWYMLHDDEKEPRKQENVKRLIREVIDNFHSILVTESNITISLAVVGPLGVGKSFFLNFLLNWGLPIEHKVGNGPLPCAVGACQTPIPIHVKFAKNVQVLFHKLETDPIPVVWFAEEELGKDTLARVSATLTLKFQEIGSDARCVELQGPFPAFRYLKERVTTRSGQLQWDIDVEFIDLPGYGDAAGNENISVELSKADVVLFFSFGQSGRPVSAEDIAQIFRSHEELEFTSRPKLVHVVRNRETQGVSSLDFSGVYENKKKELNKAWLNFFSRSSEDEATVSCYRDVRANLPQLTGEALLEKMSSESDVIYFHPENPSALACLKKVISDHVQSVKVKKKIYPFLQNVQWVAKKLRTRIGRSPQREKRETKLVEAKSGETTFETLPNMNEASDLIRSFIERTHLPLESDVKGMYHFLYNNFLLSRETRMFLLNMLKESLENFTISLVNAFLNANWSTLQDVPSDVIELVEILCRTRVQHYCQTTAPDYLLHLLDMGQNRYPFGLAEKKHWSSANDEEKKELCHQYLRILLHRFEVSLTKETRDMQYMKSHFHLISQLKKDIQELLAVRSSDNTCRTDLLRLLCAKLQMVVYFCNGCIREINPHPSFEGQADIALPEKMVDVHEDIRTPLQSKREGIVKEVTELLRRGAKIVDVIHKLETRLKLKHGELKLPQSQNDDPFLWAKTLLNVLSDKDHFDIKLEPNLVLDNDDANVERLLGLARKLLFAHQKSFVTCKIVNLQQLPENEIQLRKSTQEENTLEVLVSSEMCDELDAIRERFKDPSQHLAPIFIPTIRPGPTPDLQGNYLLQEDPWSKGVLMDDQLEEETKGISGEDIPSELNIFLVVEPQHLHTLKCTIQSVQYPKASNIKLKYVVLPQNGRGIGVTRAIIKSLAECFKFSLYWTVDDDIQFMYQFDGNNRRWRKCSVARGLLFGQRVFQTCLEKTVKVLTEEERDDLFDHVTSDWPSFAKQTKRNARKLLLDQQSFAEVQKNPNLLYGPFTKISEDCAGDAAKEEVLKACEQDFVEKCRKRLFEDTVNQIAGVSIAHESTKRSDYMSKYPSADYMRSEQQSKVVLNNARALKGMNFVNDEIVFHNQEFQVYDKEKRNIPCWGLRGSKNSFCRALTVSGVIGYQVIRIIYSHKKLLNVFDRVNLSDTALPHIPEDI